MSEERILIDASALADFFVGEEELRQHSVHLRRKFPNWTTLPLCRYEFGNVLRTYIRRGMIREEDGLSMMGQGVAMVTFCAECGDEVVLAEANASKLTFYDAAYVARARSLGVKLFTRDGDILKHCPEIAWPISGA